MKGIVLYGDGYATVEHNIPDEKAADHLKQWTDQHLPAFLFDHSHPHTHPDPETCPECGKIIEGVINHVR